jgi:PqqD family protein of HPr-rel-A system
VRFHLKQYDSEAVVFDTASGDTHYLAPLALALFKLCRGHAPPSRDDIVRLLAEYDAIDNGSFSDAQVDETLDGLRKHEMIGRQ